MMNVRKVGLQTVHRTLTSRGIPVFLLICLLSINNLHAIPRSHDRDLADAYVQTFLNVRHTDRDPDLLLTALEFYPGHGDALYLLGKHPLVPKIEAVVYLERSLNAEYWNEYSLEKAGIELFKLYNQLKRYAAATVLLSGYTFDFFTNPVDALLLTDFYRRIGDSEKYHRSLERGYSKWYEDFVGHKIAADVDFRTLLMQRIEEFPDFYPGTPALEALFEFTDREDQRYEMLLSRYVASEGFSPLLQGYAVIDGYLETEDMSAVLPYGNVIKELSALPEAVPLLEEAFENYNGTSGYDWNEDSFYEETLTFIEGMVSRHTLDVDQDGLPDTEITFASENMAENAVYRFGENVFTIAYIDYPFVETIISEIPDIEYTFDQALFPLFSINPIFYLPDDLSAVPENEIQRFAREHSVSQISSGIEYISEGDQSEYLMDSNGNGIPEYTMKIDGPETVQMWDIDEDGSPDIIQTQQGAVRRLQIFGYTITLNNGVPVELRVDGSVRELRIDGRIVWINTAPLEGVGELDPRGYFEYSGKRFYAYLYQGYLFIQPVGTEHE